MSKRVEKYSRIPQRSVLGLLLYIKYIGIYNNNDIQRYLKKYISLFVDDTLISVSSSHF